MFQYWVVPTMLAVFLIVGVSMLCYSVATRDRDGRFFVILWLGGIAFLVSNILVSWPRRLVLTDHHLYWAAMMRTGRIPVTDIAEIERRQFPSPVAIFRTSTGHELVVAMDGAAFLILCDELLALAPQIRKTDHFFVASGIRLGLLGERPDGWSSLPAGGASELAEQPERG